VPNEGINPSAVKTTVDYSTKIKDSAGFFPMLAGLISASIRGSTVGNDGIEIQAQKASDNPRKMLGTAREGLKDVIRLAVSRTGWTAISGQVKLRSCLPYKPYQASTPLIFGSPASPKCLVED